MRKALALALVAVAVAAAAALSASAGPQHATSGVTGVTRTSIKLGGTFPLSGIASIYGVIPKGMAAYFKYVNAHGGVHGRKIVWKYYDDAYDPAQTVQLTHKLVESDHVFAIAGSLGTEGNLAIRPYLNGKKIPQLLISTGATMFGTQMKQYPWTIGWQPDYVSEGKLYARWILNNAPKAKIAVLYQNDEYGQDYLSGLEAGLGKKKSLIVSKEHYEATDTQYGPQILRNKLSGADTWVLLTTPVPTVKAMLQAKAIAFRPGTIVINSVSASDAVMHAAEQNVGKDYTDGDISDSYLKNPPNPKYVKDPAIKRYKKIAHTYSKGSNTNDVIFYYGVAKAYDMVQILRHAGKNPTRASVMRAARHMNWVNPFTIKGMRVRTTRSDGFPLDQVKMIRYQSGTWSEISALMKARR